MAKLFAINSAVKALRNGRIHNGDEIGVVGLVSDKKKYRNYMYYKLELGNSVIKVYDRNFTDVSKIRLGKYVHIEGEVREEGSGVIKIQDVSLVDTECLDDLALIPYRTHSDNVELKVLYHIGIRDEKTAIEAISKSKRFNPRGIFHHKDIVNWSIEYNLPQVFKALITHKNFDAFKRSFLLDDMPTVSELICILNDHARSLTEEDYCSFLSIILETYRLNLTEKDSDGFTPFMYACMENKSNKLTSKFCNMIGEEAVNAKDDERRSALYHAIKNDAVDVVKALTNLNGALKVTVDDSCVAAALDKGYNPCEFGIFFNNY